VQAKVGEAVRGEEVKLRGRICERSGF